MTLKTTDESIAEFVRSRLEFDDPSKPVALRPTTLPLLAEAVSLLPSDEASLLLSGKRNIRFLLRPDFPLPLGMSAVSEGSKHDRRYTIVFHDEHQSVHKDLFLGMVLRRLAQVIYELPPKSEWPTARKERAEFKMRLETHADAIVWKWGLRHYSIRHITATYPPHIADEIIESVTKTLAEGNV